MEKSVVLDQIVEKFNEVKELLKTADVALLKDPEVIAIRQELKENMTFIQAEMKANNQLNKEEDKTKDNKVDPIAEIKEMQADVRRIAKVIEAASDEAIFAKEEKNFDIVKRKQLLLETWMDKNQETLEDYSSCTYELELLKIIIEETEEWINDRTKIQVKEETKSEVIDTNQVAFSWKVHERKGIKDIKKIQKKIQKVKLGKSKGQTINQLEVAIEALQNDATKESEVAELKIIFNLEKLKVSKAATVDEYWQIAAVKVQNGGGKSAGDIYLSSEGATPQNSKGLSQVTIPLKMERAEDTGFYINLKKIPDMITPSKENLHDHTIVQIPENYTIDPLKVADLFSEKKIEAKFRDLSMTVTIEKQLSGYSIEVSANDDGLYKEFSYKEKLFSKKLVYWGELKKGGEEVKVALEKVVLK